MSNLRYLRGLQRPVDVAMSSPSSDTGVLDFLRQLDDLRKTKPHLKPLVDNMEAAFVDSSGKKRVNTVDFKALADALLPERRQPLPCITQVNGERMSWFIPCKYNNDRWKSVLSVHQLLSYIVHRRKQLFCTGCLTLSLETSLVCKKRHSRICLRRR